MKKLKFRLYPSPSNGKTGCAPPVFPASVQSRLLLTPFEKRLYVNGARQPIAFLDRKASSNLTEQP